MRILLLGKDGQVGWELHRLLGSSHQVIGLGREGIELTRLEGIRDLVERSKPQVVINAAAYNAVDRAESEVDAAEAVNAIAPGILAAEAAYQSVNGGGYDTLQCLAWPASCIPGYPGDGPRFLPEPVPSAQEAGYVGRFHPGPRILDQEQRR